MLKDLRTSKITPFATAMLLGVGLMAPMAVHHIQHPATTVVAHAANTKTSNEGIASKQNSGTLTLTHPLEVDNMSQGNAQTKIPAGKTIHYKKTRYSGVLVWGGGLKNDPEHKYNADEDSFNKQTKGAKKGAVKGQPNIAAANKNAKNAQKNKGKRNRMNGAHASANANQRNKKGLPRTSDTKENAAGSVLGGAALGMIFGFTATDRKKNND